jgi:hypothetical protein
MLRLYFDEDAMDDAPAAQAYCRAVARADGEPPGVPQRLVLRGCGAGDSRPLARGCFQRERSPTPPPAAPDFCRTLAPRSPASGSLRRGGGASRIARRSSHLRLVIPEVLRIEVAPKGAKVTATAISRADDRLAPIRYDGEWMLWGWNPNKEEPFLVSVEYGLLTRAEVFRRFAAQAREAVAAAVALADEEAEEGDGIDRTLDPDELMPGGVVFMVARPFPAVYLEGETIH